MPGWFRRKPTSPFPADMLQRLDRLGRCSLDIMDCGIDCGEVAKNCVVVFYERAMADPDRFLSDLLRLIEGEPSGFTTFGAANLMYELASDHVRSETGGALVDRAIDFKLSRGLPPGLSFNGYELERWRERRH